MKKEMVWTSINPKNKFNNYIFSKSNCWNGEFYSVVIKISEKIVISKSSEKKKIRWMGLGTYFQKRVI